MIAGGRHRVLTRLIPENQNGAIPLPATKGARTMSSAQTNFVDLLELYKTMKDPDRPFRSLDAKHALAQRGPRD